MKTKNKGHVYYHLALSPNMNTGIFTVAYIPEKLSSISSIEVTPTALP